MLADYIDVFSRAFLSLALAMPRMHMALMFVPVMGLKEIQGLVKIAIVIGVSIPVAVHNYYTVDTVDLGSAGYTLIVLKESIIGAILGLLLSLPFNLFLSVGAIIDNQRGATSGQMFDPTLGNTSLLGAFMQKTFSILLIEAGMFYILFGLVMDTYVLWPVWDFYPEPLFTGQEIILNEFSSMTQKIMLYTMPILIIMLLIDLAFAVLGLFSPQLQVYFLSMPAKSVVALAALVMYSGSLWYYGVLEIENYQKLHRLLPLMFKVSDDI